MGCSPSKIENVETLNRCMKRKAFMKQSVSARNAFAAAHFAYAAALKDTGAALSDYAQGELQFPSHLPDPLAPPHRSNDPLRPPTHLDSTPLVRNATTECEPRSNVIMEEVNMDDETDDYGLKHQSRYKSFIDGKNDRATEGITGDISRSGNSKLKMENESLPPPPPPPENNGFASWDFFCRLMQDVPGPMAEVGNKSSRIKRVEIQREVLEDQNEHDGGREIRSGSSFRTVVEKSEEKPPPMSLPPNVMRPSMKEDGQNMNLLQVFTEIDDCFVKASESAHEVSKILEANRLHYHSNFAHNPGHIHHSTRVMRVITWNRSCKGPPIAEVVKEEFASEEKETHATVLDKILAWEKKLYDEVKAGEEMKYEYQRKIASLNKLTKRGASSDSLERTKATVGHLHTKCIVHLQFIDSTVSEINRLRDEQLYPILAQLVEEMDLMWENMQKRHENQSKIVQELRSIKIPQSKELTSGHNINTKQLHVHVQLWWFECEKLTVHQREYIRSLNNWLKLNLVSIDNNLRDKVSTPQKPQNLRIQSLLRTWQEQLEKLPEERAKTAINTFAAAIDTIIHYQSVEMKMKERCEETRRELMRKCRKFDEWCDKHMTKRTPTDVMYLDVEDDMEVIAEQQRVVEALKKRLEEEEEAYRRQCVQVKDKSLMNLKSGLAEVFTAMSEYSGACSRMYGSLKSYSTRGTSRYSNGSS